MWEKKNIDYGIEKWSGIIFSFLYLFQSFHNAGRDILRLILHIFRIIANRIGTSDIDMWALY